MHFSIYTSFDATIHTHDLFSPLLTLAAEKDYTEPSTGLFFNSDRKVLWITLATKTNNTVKILTAAKKSFSKNYLGGLYKLAQVITEKISPSNYPIALKRPNKNR